jgi:hypothetical protein
MAKVRVSGVPYEVDMPEDEALKAYTEFAGSMRDNMERWLYFKAGWMAAIKHMETKNDSE